MKRQFYDIGNRRELFIDDLVTEETSENVVRKLHSPVPHEPDPTAPRGAYQTVIFDNGRIRRYYRGDFADFTLKGSDAVIQPGYIGEFTGYAEGRDGFRWMKPEALIYACGIPNVILCLSEHNITHNFTPFLDGNPVRSEKARFKALGGTPEGGGLFALFSPDGVHWNLYGKKPVLTSPDARFPYLFDSQNVSFWSKAENRYVCYFRVNLTRDGRELRSIARMDSADFLLWENFRELDINLENENLYVSQIQPYFRAEHIYVGTPTRYFDERESATDITLCFSREGGPILRPYPEAWIRPGLELENWSNRYNYLACGIVPTSENEMTLFHDWSGVRYTLRYDGFISLSTGYAGGEWRSKVLRYSSGRLEFNISTSAGGLAVAELQTPDGKPIPGYEFDSCEPMYGDTIVWNPRWKYEQPLPEGVLFRIACRFREADIYSFAFAGQERKYEHSASSAGSTPEAKEEHAGKRELQKK